MDLLGMYLLKAEMPPDDDNDWPMFTDPIQEIVVYATGKELIEMVSHDDETIANNVEYDANGKKVFNIDKYQLVDAGVTSYVNIVERQKAYSDIRPLFDGDEFRELFAESSEIDAKYMQLQIGQHIRWHHHEEDNDVMYAKCMKEILEFKKNGNKYPGYDPDFKMPSPEEIEEMRKARDAKNALAAKK